MLIYHRTSIFDSPAQTVVNTVNCVGVMGKGVAAEFRKRYPVMFEQYQEICARKLMEPGKLWLWKGPDQWILNFPTKRHWRNPSRLEWIDAGLRKFAAEYENRGITEISFPRLGCGNGGLKWDDVRPLMEAHLSELPITVYVHDYEVNIGSPEHMEKPPGSAVRIDRSFSDFVNALHLTVDQQAGRFATLRSNREFRAEFVPDQRLRFDNDGRIAEVDVEDLRSVWMKLLKGVVTERAVDWGLPEVTGEHILSLLRMMRDIRTVEIQRRTAQQPELAVELRRRGGTQLTEDADPSRPS